jgi:hypothetical protein
MTWYDNNWNYRKAITISNSGSALTDYQVLVTIDTASLITSIPSKMRSDCGDIRFTSSDGSTLLNHWIESGANTNSTIIWVKIPSISSGSNTIYLYYNNPSATYDNSVGGADTFIFFDDFSGNLSQWTHYGGYGGSSIITSGVLLVHYGDLGGWEGVASNITFGYNTSLRIRSRFEYATSYTRYGSFGYRDIPPSSRNNAIGESGNNYYCSAKDASITSYLFVPATTTSFHIYEINHISSTESRFYVDDTWITTLGSNVPDNIPAGIYMDDYQGMYVDWVFVRNCVSTEPTFSSIGTEEAQSSANITATNMIITPSDTPCVAGTCTMTVDVTWTNTGGTSGSFVPNITIDTVAIYPDPFPSESLGAGLSVSHTFIVSGLTTGTHNICPSPN